MDVKWLWLGIALCVVVVLVVIAAALWPGRASKRADAVLMAHAARLRRIPRYRTLVRHRQLATAVRCLAVLFLLAGTIVLVSRPTSEEVNEETVANRDILLCLDVSGSMTEYDEDIAREFSRIAEELEGERIGLAIWSEVAVTVFPLTDDYDFVVDQLDEAADALGDSDYSFVAGVQIGRRKGSLIGDGLASCVDRFDRPDEERGRAIVLASDNDPQGKGVFTLQEAADYAADEDVVVYGFGTPSMDSRPGATRGFEEAVEGTGGQLQVMGEGSLGGIVDGINRLESKRSEKPPEVIVNDEPWWGAGLTSAGVVLVLLAGIGRRS